MDTMNTLKKPGFMATLRNRKGFSLIEIAIVLVIIGIIIGAIIKGQDLLFNSRAKQLAATANSWKVSALAYMDRNGAFPGDGGKDGNIASGATASEIASGGSAIDEIAGSLSNAPANPVLIGGQSYWFYLGFVSGTNGPRNAIVVCPSVDCQTPLSPDAVEMFKALDTSTDGSADSGAGQMRAISAKPSSTTIDSTLSPATGGRANGVVLNPTIVDITAGGTASPVAWSSSQYGALWAFDKQF